MSYLPVDRPPRAPLCPKRLAACLAILALTGLGCAAEPVPPGQPPAPRDAAPAPPRRAAKDSPPDPYFQRRLDMVQTQLRSRDIRDPRVLDAMGRVPRHRFVPPGLVDQAYADHPLPIGHGQTISQPYIVALMTQLVRPKPNERALDIGTGSGYQAAILAELCKEVYSIEIVKPLAEQARKRLADLGYKNVTVRAGDGYRGWPEHAPFDVIVVAAAADHVPKPLIDQLARGGRLVMPVGQFAQQLTLIEKQPDGSIRRRVEAPVIFVPMTGEAQSRSEH
ncbi:MAG: protein-L-isoaspartate(D-aspartate) O-methyltransferase [Thermoguttaceae bacterium]